MFLQVSFFHDKLCWWVFFSHLKNSEGTAESVSPWNQMWGDAGSRTGKKNKRKDCFCHVCRYINCLVLGKEFKCQIVVVVAVLSWLGVDMELLGSG